MPSWQVVKFKSFAKSVHQLKRNTSYCNCIPVKYDAIRFYVGYNKDRDTALVEVVGAHTEVFVDDDGNPISYDYKGDEYWAEQVVYDLGKVLEHNIRDKSKTV